MERLQESDSSSPSTPKDGLKIACTRRLNIAKAVGEGVNFWSELKETQTSQKDESANILFFQSLLCPDIGPKGIAEYCIQEASKEGNGDILEGLRLAVIAREKPKEWYLKMITLCSLLQEAINRSPSSLLNAALHICQGELESAGGLDWSLE